MAECSTPSAVLAVSAAASVYARPARLSAVTLLPGSAVATLIIYDNAGGTATGTVLCKLVAAANGNAAVWHPEGGVACNAGIAYALTGTAAEAIVHYNGQ